MSMELQTQDWSQTATMYDNEAEWLCKDQVQGHIPSSTENFQPTIGIE
jgi:hypothetical protein